MPKDAVKTEVATLRFGISDTGATSLCINMNGKEVCPFTNVGGRGANMIRDGIEGTWVGRDFEFDASLLKVGDNQIVLTVPVGGVTNGICYDVIRLEVRE